MSKLIPVKIPKGETRYAIVDDEFEYLSRWQWFLLNGRYAYRNSGNYMHRLIANAPKGMEVDHINGNTLDNQRANLRVCTHAQNRFNTSSPFHKPKTSQYKGVSFCKERNKWMASIQVRSKAINLGRFSVEVDAARAYDKAARHYFGEFSRPNFPEE